MNFFKENSVSANFVKKFRDIKKKKKPSILWPSQNFLLYTPRQKSIRALEIVLAIFLCFECQFLSFYACYKEYKA